jgi:hypothetical protein
MVQGCGSQNWATEVRSSSTEGQKCSRIIGHRPIDWLLEVSREQDARCLGKRHMERRWVLVVVFSDGSLGGV